MLILLRENLSESFFIRVKVFLTVLVCILISVSGTLPSGQLSNIPWRRTGVKYTNNEAYFDVVEEVDAIIDKAGATVFAEIQGYVRLFSFLFFFNISLFKNTFTD